MGDMMQECNDFNSQREVWEYLLGGNLVIAGDVVYGMDGGRIRIMSPKSKYFISDSARSFAEHNDLKKFKLPEWYEEIPPQGILCFVKDTGDTSWFVRLIKKFVNTETGSSYFVDDFEQAWDMAEPMSLSAVTLCIWGGVMFDCEVDYDGDNDNYNYYNDIGGIGGGRTVFIPDRDYYHTWYHFDRVINISNGYRVLQNNIWSFIPLKVVRRTMNNSLFSHKAITDDILLRDEFRRDNWW